LLYARRGTQYIKQAETVLTVSAGDSLILDSTKTSALTFCSETDALLLAIPRSWIRGWLPAPELVVGQIFKAGATWAGTLNSALGNLRAESIAELSLSGSILAEQLAGLLALATPATTPTPLNSHRRSLLGRLVDVLRERCHDPALDPAAVAASLRLSRRYVHALFAAMGTTFSRELYNLRLQRARRLLEDQRFAGLSINEIAWNCGFNETSHFRRRFRRQFGVSPNEFRHTTTKI
jgi:AraC-like DNA-binding protein